jgi:hypothetical protein
MVLSIAIKSNWNMTENGQHIWNPKGFMLSDSRIWMFCSGFVMFVKQFIGLWKHGLLKNRKVSARIPLPTRLRRATFPPGEGFWIGAKHESNC